MSWGKLDNTIVAIKRQSNSTATRPGSLAEEAIKRNSESEYINLVKKIREFPDCTDNEEYSTMWAVEYTSFVKCPSCGMDVNVDWEAFKGKRCPFCNQLIQLDVFIT